VQAADEVITFDLAVRHEATAVHAATVEYRYLISVTDHDQIDFSDKGVEGPPILQFAPDCHFDLFRGITLSHIGFRLVGGTW
jgi:hypothetical protein